MLLKDLKIGFAITGSFCTFKKVIPEVEKLVSEGADVYPIISDVVDKYETRFANPQELKQRLKNITGKNIIRTIVEAEPIGPKSMFDILVVAPCTGNTIAKLSNSIADTPVTMACKSHLRNNRPVVIAISTNDGLGGNAKNIGLLMNMKNIYMVPYKQDNPSSKPYSLAADTSLIISTILEALKGKQLQPVLICEVICK